MKALAVPAAIAAALCLASCVTPSAPLSAVQKKTLHIANITAATRHEVMMERDVLDRIVGRVRNEIRMSSPNVLGPAAAGDPAPLTMQLVFTDYQGPVAVSANSRSNVGTIHIDAEVLFLDGGGKTVAQSTVSTHFGSGGDVGLTTNILNVEADFEIAVAALVR